MKLVKTLVPMLDVGHSRRSSLIRLGLVSLAALLLSGATAALATMTMRLDLPHIVAAADRAFVGRVVSVHADRDAAGLPSTWITFAVDHVIKGTVGGTLTIKQFGTTAPLSDGSVLRLPGLPTYAPGDEMILFLSGESTAGFSSPIGLAQGKFPIVRRAGHAMVAATVETVGTLQSMRSLRTARAPAAGAITLNEFLDHVAQLVAQSAGK